MCLGVHRSARRPTTSRHKMGCVPVLAAARLHSPGACPMTMCISMKGAKLRITISTKADSTGAMP
uniref:Uncharacterized protein n=1 Tax=Arundo donax TaxID=35708 RepID=A0A0A9BSP1_ARUDO